VGRGASRKSKIKLRQVAMGASSVAYLIPLEFYEKNKLFNTLRCLFITIIALGFFSACEKGDESQTKTIAKYHDFSLANASDHKVYGFYQFGESKGMVGVVSVGASKTQGFMPFSHVQKAIVSFKCSPEDENPCAVGEVDVSKHYPTGQFKSITTIFTYRPENTVELSFSVSEIGSEPGVRKIISVGNISNNSNQKMKADR